MVDDTPHGTRTHGRFEPLGLVAHLVIWIPTGILSVLASYSWHPSWLLVSPTCVALVLIIFNTVFHHGEEPRWFMFIVFLIIEPTLGFVATSLSVVAFVMLFWVD